MICKIIDTSDILIDGIKHFEQYNTYFTKGCLFVSDRNDNDLFYKNINDFFTNSQITIITENNLVYESSHIIEWAKKEFVNTDLIRYEKDNQQKLQNIMKQLDYVEQELFERGEEQCQKRRKSEEDLRRTKKPSILAKILHRLK